MKKKDIRRLISIAMLSAYIVNGFPIYAMEPSSTEELTIENNSDIQIEENGSLTQDAKDKEINLQEKDGNYNCKETNKDFSENKDNVNTDRETEDGDVNNIEKIDSTDIKQPEYIDNKENEKNKEKNKEKNNKSDLIVNIPDPGLREAIANELGRSSDDDILISELENITSLSANNKNIENLEGIQYCIRLKQLDIPNNRISDISQLSYLSDLVSLTLYYNKVEDISPLSNLNSLEAVNLYGNKIKNTEPLKNLTKLKSLQLGGNGLTEVTGLDGLINLTTLYIDANRIKDISFIKNLTNLESLNLNHNYSITDEDITVIQNLHKLKLLGLKDNKIENIEPIRNLSQLTQLDLYGNKIIDLTPLNGLRNLKILTLENNEISDISTLENLSNLETLTIHNNKISEISSLRGLNKLKEITLFDNYIDVSNDSEANIIINEIKNNNPGIDLKFVGDGYSQYMIKNENRDISLGVDEVYTPNIEFGKTLDGIGFDGTPQNIKLSDITYEIADENVLAVNDLNELVGKSFGSTDVKVIYKGIGGGGSTTLNVTVVNKDIITIPDQGLREAIQEKLGKSDGEDILKSELENMTGVLDAKNKDISNLDGIQYCTNLSEINLLNNNIEDISLLSNLTNLTKLNLSINRIFNLEDLSGLTNLTHLLFERNQVEDISPLANMTKLIHLNANYNSISDISPIVNMVNMNDIGFSGNGIQDISPISALKRVKVVHLAKNGLSDISPLSELRGVTLLRLSDNNITDISALTHTINKGSLFLDKNKISDISPLANASGLNHLYLSQNNVSDIEPLRSFTNIEILEIADNKIEGEIPSWIGDFTKLTRLELQNNKLIGGIPAELGNLPKLKDLKLDNNQLIGGIPEEIKNNVPNISIKNNFIDGELNQKELIAKDNKVMELEIGEEVSQELLREYVAVDNGGVFEDLSKNYKLKLAPNSDYFDKNSIPRKNGSTTTKIMLTDGEKNNNYAFTKNNVSIEIKDTKAPDIEYTVSTNEWVSDGVTINVIANDNSGVSSIVLPDGEKVNMNSVAYKVSKNGIYSFRAEDVSNNIKYVDIQISNIDKKKPNIKIEFDESKTNKSVEVSIFANDFESGVKEIVLPDGTIVPEDKATFEVENNGEFTFIAIDNAGNVSEDTLKINNIDRTPPELTLTPVVKGWTNKGFSIKIKAFSLNGIKSIKLPDDTCVNSNKATFDVSENGEYIVEVEDKIGNITRESILIDNIDKTKPILISKILQSNNKKTVSVQLTASDEDSGVKEIRVSNGDVYLDSENIATFKKNGRYTVIAEDYAGNIVEDIIEILEIEEVDNDDGENILDDGDNKDGTVDYNVNLINKTNDNINPKAKEDANIKDKSSLSVCDNDKKIDYDINTDNNQIYSENEENEGTLEVYTNISLIGSLVLLVLVILGFMYNKKSYK